MFSLIGITATLFMLKLLPDAAFNGDRKIVSLFIVAYSVLYCFIIQNSMEAGFVVVTPCLAALMFGMLLLSMNKYFNKMPKKTDYMVIGLFIAVPLALYVWISVPVNTFHVIDVFIVAAIIAVNQVRIIKMPMIFKENTVEFYGLSIMVHLLILYIFLGYRNIALDLSFNKPLTIWLIALAGSFFCVCCAALIGFKLKYLVCKGSQRRGKDYLVLAVFNFLHVAIAEEILFRGIVYNYIFQLITGQMWVALGVSTLIFGCHHISFGGKKMFVLSTVAGFFYGLVFCMTNSIIAAAVVHSITNIIWRLFFIIRPEGIKEQNIKQAKTQ